MSMSRACEIWKATDNRWYVMLGDFEYAYEDHECSFYGPFATEAQLESYIRRFPNPGASCTDDSGTQPPPAQELLS